jgi:histidine triad (HIT) family protein
MDCIFCKIISSNLGSKLIYEDEHLIAFDDINPQAPCHKLIVPREHIATLNDLPPEKLYLAGHLISSAQKIAKILNIAKDGYRLVINCNVEGGQTVPHIHVHLLGGRSMTWPPG